MGIIRLEPVFKEMIWGGDKLSKDWNYNVAGSNIGECWGISAHGNGDCRVLGEEFGGKTLSQLWIERQDLFGNVDSDRFPLLVKIIDAKADLSIQVHPNDDYAKVNENGSLGKTECWYILDAQPNSTLVIGHNARTKDELKDMIYGKRWLEFIREVKVKKGDFIQIDPGTVHAIKGGIQILETQQNSDITYRVYDYDRLSNGKPRELHVEKSIDVITVPAKAMDQSVVHIENEQDNYMKKLIECKYYKVWKIGVVSELSFEQDYSFVAMTVVDGEGTINGEGIHKGDHFIVPFNFGKVELSGNMEIIASSI